MTREIRYTTAALEEIVNKLTSTYKLHIILTKKELREKIANMIMDPNDAWKKNRQKYQCPKEFFKN